MRKLLEQAREPDGGTNIGETDLGQSGYHERFVQVPGRGTECQVDFLTDNQIFPVFFCGNSVSVLPEVVFSATCRLVSMRNGAARQLGETVTNNTSRRGGQVRLDESSRRLASSRSSRLDLDSGICGMCGSQRIARIFSNPLKSFSATSRRADSLDGGRITP